MTTDTLLDRQYRLLLNLQSHYAELTYCTFGADDWVRVSSEIVHAWGELTEVNHALLIAQGEVTA